MTVRAGETLDSCCARLHDRLEADKTALRLRIEGLEADLERERESSSTLAALVMIVAESAP